MELNPREFKPKGFLRNLNRNLVTGALAVGPIAITLFLLWKGFQMMDGILATLMNFLIRDILHIEVLGGKPIPGLGFITLIIILLITGYSARHMFGNWMLVKIRGLISQIPLVNRIYKAIEQISQAIFSGQREVFKRAVLIEYPRKGIYSIAIMTADTGGMIQDKLPEDSISVFLPTTPNPTSGFLLFVPKREVIELEISVEDALKLIISGGTVNTRERSPQNLSRNSRNTAC